MGKEGKISTTGLRGAGSAAQLMKLVPGQQLIQGAAGDIDTKDVSIIQFCEACKITLNGSGPAVAVAAGDCYECSMVTKITTDIHVSYRYL